jgi:hypothetical protein
LDANPARDPVLRFARGAVQVDALDAGPSFAAVEADDVSARTPIDRTQRAPRAQPGLPTVV